MLPEYTRLPNGRVIKRVREGKYLIDGRYCEGSIDDRGNRVYVSVNTSEGNLINRVFTSLVKAVEFFVRSDNLFLD